MSKIFCLQYQQPQVFRAISQTLRIMTLELIVYIFCVSWTCKKLSSCIFRLCFAIISTTKSFKSLFPLAINDLAPKTIRKKLNIVSYSKLLGLGKNCENTGELIILSFHSASLMFASCLRVKDFISTESALRVEALDLWSHLGNWLHYSAHLFHCPLTAVCF